MGGRDGGATVICASGGGGPQCGPADARGGACQPGGTFVGSLKLLLFTGKVGGVQKKIRECNSPNRSGSCHVHHGVLAVRGFGDMGTCARNRMVRDRFIADQ